MAPAIAGKAITIEGDATGLRPRVGGDWQIQNIPGSRSLILSHLELFGLGGLGGLPDRVFYIAATSCPGAIVLDDLVGDPNYTFHPQLFQTFGDYGTRFVDCNLVTIQRCHIYGLGYWTSLRSTLMISDSVLQAQHTGGVFGGPALMPAASKVTIMGSLIRGASATTALHWNNNQSAIRFRNTDFWVGGRSVIAGGGDYYFNTPMTSMQEGDSWFPSGLSLLTLDFSAATFPGGLYPNQFVTYVPMSLTGMSPTWSATSLQVSQYTTAPSLAVLAIGSLSPQSWTNLVGPAFVDPAGASVYFDPSPATGSLVRTFAIPPGLPVGLTVALQAFELDNNGRVATSNVTFAGIW
jgi:hypothetical protein